MKRSRLVIGMSLWALAAVSARAEDGAAMITATAPDSPITGTVSFQDTPAGLKVSARLKNVPPGDHGFHIHEFGACGDSGKTAGSHYNPDGTPHGMAMKTGMKGGHPGDMGNITADAQGNASLELTLPQVSLTGGKYGVGGRAVILHEKSDDFSQPTGNAGGRIGCGPILITVPSSEEGCVGSTDTCQ